MSDKNIHQQLRDIQRKMVMKKDAKGKRGTYRDIETIMTYAKKYMNTQDVVLWRTDSIESVQDGSFARVFIKVQAALMDMEGNKSEISCGIAEIGSLSRMDKSQQSGAASTYAHRRALSNLFAIDDGSEDPDKPEGNMLELECEIEDAIGINSLSQIGKKIKTLSISSDDREHLKSLYRARKKMLEAEGEKPALQLENKKTTPQLEMDSSLL
jgi:hypothetical protein